MCVANKMYIFMVLDEECVVVAWSRVNQSALDIRFNLCVGYRWIVVCSARGS